MMPSTTTIKVKNTPLSESPYLRYASSFFGTMALGFGLVTIMYPRFSLTFFNFAPPTMPAEAEMVDRIMVMFGAKDLLTAACIYIGAVWGDRTVLGLIMIASGLVATVDGIMCRAAMSGAEWSHWGYAPALVTIGGLLLGALDGRAK